MSKQKLELKEGTGFLHKSVEKTKEGSPDYFGSVKHEGIEYKISGWKKEGTNSDYVHLSLENTENSFDENKEIKDELSRKFKKELKKSSADKFLICELTGSLHVQADETKNEDFFGSIKINETLISLQGVVAVKNGKPYIYLTVSKGMDKKERAKVAKNFI